MTCSGLSAGEPGKQNRHADGDSRSRPMLPHWAVGSCSADHNRVPNLLNVVYLTGSFEGKFRTDTSTANFANMIWTELAFECRK